MSKICQITGKKALTGNNVSHAKNKTKRKFFPNLQNAKFYSPNLKKNLSLKICVSTLKTIEKNGGLDKFLLKTSDKHLAPEAVKIKKLMLKQNKQN